MLSNVLQDIAGRQKEHTSDIGVIFDECDASNLTEGEARNLDKSLLEMEDPYVLILCQSMEITHKKVISRLIKCPAHAQTFGYCFLHQNKEIF